MSLKKQTTVGFGWSFLENAFKRGFGFIVNIILARLLSPNDFGLIGMLMIFIAISQELMRGGFPQALIRKMNCTQDDYSTVFYFNILASIIICIVLWFTSNTISQFFKEPILSKMINVIGFGVVINAFGVVHSAILTKNMNFKLQMQVAFVASFLSGVTAIIMAYKGFGVWSLVLKILLELSITSLMLIIITPWKPSFLFSRKSFSNLFGFGMNLLLTRLIETIYRYVYNIVIGKFFSTAALGFYTKADQFRKLPSEHFSSIISRVTFPALSKINENEHGLRRAYKKILKGVTYINAFVLIGMMVLAEPMIISLIGEKWLNSSEFLQLLCLAGLFYPIRSLNLNVLKVKGRSDLMLRLQLLKKLLVIPIIIIGVSFGIKVMIIGMIFYEFISYLIDSYWSGILIDYSTLQQLKDIMPLILVITLGWGTIYIAISIFSGPHLMRFIFGGIGGFLLIVLLSELFHLKSYLMIKDEILNKLKGNNNN